MGRPRKPDGRRVHENVMLSEDEAALIDAARGDVKRGPWIRQAAVDAARRRHGTGTVRAVSSVPPVRGGALSGTGTISAAPPGEELPRGASLEECPHPPARILRGLCNACGKYVGS